MEIIAQNNGRYLPHTLTTRLHVVKLYKSGEKVSYILRKYHISKASLYRWVNKFDGTERSLTNKSHRPLTKNSRAHTDEEINNIKEVRERFPQYCIEEIWYILKNKYNYTRTIHSLRRMIKIIYSDKKSESLNTSKRKIQKYNTPEKIGGKWQIDVKYVPQTCILNDFDYDKKFYQYTCIDEATRQRYLYWYEEHTPANTVDFIKRAIKFFNYIPKEIQTDNGTEFTFNRSYIGKVHPMDKLCHQLNIIHHKIRPRTPQHNGKVERSHRNDNERFYTYLSFSTLDELRVKGSAYLLRSNNIPMSVLGYLTPNEMRQKIESYT